jgi:capsular exopolysaccharide synthesis family protein
MQETIAATAEPGLSAETVNLRHYWHVILERRWLVITGFISVFLLCLVYLYKAPRIYSALTRLQIDREAESAFTLREGIALGVMDQDYLQTQYKNLMSRTLIEAVYRKLRLEKDPRYIREVDPIRALSDDISITPIRLSRLVDVRVEHGDPERAKQIANALASEFMDRNLAQRQKKTFDQIVFLRNQADSVKQDVEKADRALQDYRVSSKIVSLDSERNTIFLALSQVQADYAKSQNEAKTAQTAVDELEKHIQAGKSLETFPQIANDMQFKQAQIQLAALENELAGLLQKYKDKHPTVIAANAKIAEAKEAVATIANQVAETLRTEARVAKAREEALYANYKEWEDKQMKWNEAKLKYDVLSRDAETSKLLYNQVLSKMKEIDLVGQDKANNIRVIDPAVAPLRHFKPRVVLTLLLGLFGGLAIAAGLAFFVNYLDDSIKTQDDVETYLRLPFLGYVPNIKSNSVVERDLQAHLHPQSNGAESFRTIRAALSLSHKADRLRILTITSTIPAEGKSLVATNLAIVLAQTGLRTLLVDADMRRPSVHKVFQLHSPVGLSAYLMDKANGLEELIHTTEVPNLDVVCCGATPQSPSELIGSRRMNQFLQEVGKRYDRVVMDCPPVSAVSDPLVMSSMADGVLFITKFNKIRREHARKTIQRIQDAGIHICGVVLNDIDFEGRDSYYYSYYYYQNRYYSSYYHRKTEEGKGKPAEAKKV